jgi:hypothetical protein
MAGLAAPGSEIGFIAVKAALTCAGEVEDGQEVVAERLQTHRRAQHKSQDTRDDVR